MKKIVALVVVLFFVNTTKGQISPPGLGDTNTAVWTALGVKEQLDSLNAITVYAGMGRISGPGSDNPLDKPSIGVLNAEVYHTLSTHFKYSYAMSYRRQSQYTDAYPYHLEHPAIKQEFRAYGRLAYSFKGNNGGKYSLTLRQEVREFFAPDFNAQSYELQLRTRVKAGVWMPLGNDGNGLTGTAEALFSIADEHGSWGNYEYKESRFCLYYTYVPVPRMVVDVGYMNDLMGYGHHIADANYLAVDVVLVDVF
ncbi:hypothetical protein AM493_17900 [Flavobacterium akiainvivens]|uniref:DUF2490 domain-containing protein n=1 Tax=Flavobacterium akiainvivens TaxID=1202724 RepID=A0A0M8ML09_9FLAO|nr:DUF2490 domain-containing protein [Flavobacterium akiainvivens]KOS07708.1 hypothetical protein AM493_17900 [Flavobacterium akiainvivens]SFQ24716.1 Protein of unknown function [Flavobacterium akiainvivens]